MCIDKTGKYISTINLDKNIFSFAFDVKGGLWLDKGNVSSIGRNKYLIYKKGNTEHALLSVPDYLENMTISPFYSLVNVKENIHFLPGLTNVVYECKDNGTVKTLYTLDFGSLWPTEHFLKKNNKQHPLFVFKKLQEEDYVTELNFYETDKHLLFSFYCRAKHYLFLYQKVTKQKVLLIDTKNEYPMPVSIENDYIVTLEFGERNTELTKYQLLFNQAK